jgi:MFS-type transporter involved in bile tolerance (Atg22 family)
VATIALVGSSRLAILSVILFFAVGAALLSLVDVEAGRKVAREAEVGLVPAAASSAGSH